MSQVRPWFERNFDFPFPANLYPNVCARLHGGPARLEEVVRGVSREVLLHKPAGEWSAQEHAGHLFDLESLWLTRVEDFFGDGDVLTVADLTNRKTHEANHNAAELSDILLRFRTARSSLFERLSSFTPDVFARTKLHPRLSQPMRLVDHLYFVAEHDDHHLAMIWELLAMHSRSW